MIKPVEPDKEYVSLADMLLSNKPRKSNEEYLHQVKPFFENAFINDNDELILEPKNNVYFMLDNLIDDFDFDCKMLEFLIRPAHKGMSRYWERYFRRGLFSYFRRTWTWQEMSHIYTKIGCRIRSKLTREFITSGFDMNLIKVK